MCRTLRASSVSTDSTATSRPARMMPTRPATCCTSSSECDDRNTVRPSAAVSRTSDRNVSWTSGSSPLVGSSSTARLGRCMNAWIRPIFCRLPLERSRTGRSSCPPRRSASVAISRSWPPPRRAASDASCARPVAAARAQVAGQVADRPAGRPAVPPGVPPSSAARPAVGRIRSSRMRISVLLPAPFGPRNPNTSPCSTRRSTSTSACTSPPYVLERPAVSIAGVRELIVL